MPRILIAFFMALFYCTQTSAFEWKNPGGEPTDAAVTADDFLSAIMKIDSSYLTQQAINALVDEYESTDCELTQISDGEHADFMSTGDRIVGSPRDQVVVARGAFEGKDSSAKECSISVAGYTYTLMRALVCNNWLLKRESIEWSAKSSDHHVSREGNQSPQEAILVLPNLDNYKSPIVWTNARATYLNDLGIVQTHTFLGGTLR